MSELDSALRHRSDVYARFQAVLPAARYRVSWAWTKCGNGWCILRCRQRFRNSRIDDVFLGPFVTRKEARGYMRSVRERGCVKHEDCRKEQLLGKECLIEQLATLGLRGLFHAGT